MVCFASMFALGVSANGFAFWSGFKDFESNSERPGPMLDIPHLSFRTPHLVTSEHASNWQFDGAAMPLKKTTLLLPGIPQRAGRLSARLPLDAENFASTFEIRVEGNSQEMLSGGGIFFTKSVSGQKPKLPLVTKSTTLYYEELKRSGFGFYGFHSVFAGFGVVFRTHLNGEYRPSVAIVTNDGTRNYADDRFENKPHMYKIFDFRNSKDFVTVRLQVARGIIKVDVLAEEAVGWIEVGRERLPKVLHNNDHWDVAFSALSSMNQARPSHTASTWFLRDVRVMARDAEAEIKRELEKMGIPPNATNTAAWLLEAADHLSHEHVRNDPAAQTKIIKHITELVDNYLTHEVEDHALYSRRVTNLARRIRQVNADTDQLRKEILMLVGSKHSAHVMRSMRAQIGELQVGLRNEERSHSKAWDNMRGDFDGHKRRQHDVEVSAMINSMNDAQSLQENVMAYHKHLTYMILTVLVAAAVLGVMLYRKIRSYEKKHLL